jgi:hypothetical protein
MRKLTVVCPSTDLGEDLSSIIETLGSITTQHEVQIIAAAHGRDRDDSEPHKKMTPVASDDFGMGSWSDIASWRDAVHGDLIAVIDKQTRLSKGWLDPIMDASVAYPDASAFCTQVRAIVPDGLLKWQHHCRTPGLAFGQFLLKMPQGPLPRWAIPFGAILVLRKTSLESLTLTSYKPKGLPIWSFQGMEIFTHLSSEGKDIVFVPNAAANYFVTEAQMSMKAQFERAFDGGRIAARLGTDVTTTPSCWNDDADPTIAFCELGVQLNFEMGQLVCHAELGRDKLCRLLCLRLAALGWSEEAGLLCRSASEWLAGPDATELKEVVRSTSAEAWRCCAAQSRAEHRVNRLAIRT